MYGDLAVIGACSIEAAYLFARSGSTWIQRRKLVASDGATGDRFGCTTAAGADAVLVGAEYDDDNGIQSGSAYVFSPLTP
jgi:hypothetical protein